MVRGSKKKPSWEKLIRMGRIKALCNVQRVFLEEPQEAEVIERKA